MLNLGSLVATLGVDPSGLALATREMRKWELQAKRSVASVNASLRTTGAEMKKVGRSISRYITLPLTLAGVAAFKLAKDFEFSLSKITSLVGVASEQVAKWGEELLILAPQLGKAPKELADALFFVTSAGLRGALAMDVLTMSAKASAAGLGETKVVADLVTSAMNAYSPAVLSATMATDILVNTVRKGKVEADALTTSLGWVIPVSSALGVSFDQVGAAVASMTRTGTSARTASVQLRQILFSMLKPSDQAREGLEKMGTSATLLRKKLREDGLISTLLELKNLQKEYGEETLATIFPNIRALAGVLDIVGANMKNNVEIFKSLSDSTGLASEAFRIASDTVEFKWQQAIAQAKTTLTEFGKTLVEIFIPILQSLVSRLQKITSWFNQLADANKRLVIFIAGLTAALGPLLIILGFLVANILPGLITVGLRLVKVFKTFFLLLETNPFVFLATAIALILIPLINLRRETKKATEAQKELNKAIQQGEDLLINTRSIAQRVSVVRNLNKRQLDDLNFSINAQIAAEEDFTSSLQAELVKRLKADEALTRLKKQLSNTEVDALKAGILRQIQLRKEAIATDLELENKKGQDRLKLLKDYVLLVEKELEKLAEIEKKGSQLGFTGRFETPDKLDPIVSPVSFDPDEAALWQERILLIFSMRDALKSLENEYSLFGGALDMAKRKQQILKDTMVSLKNSGIDPNSEVMQQLKKDYEEAVEAADDLIEKNKEVENSFINLSGAANQFISDIASTFGSALTQLLTGTVDIQEFGNKLLSALGSFLITIGEAMVAYAVGVAAFEAAFTNPVAAALLGGLVIVAGTLVRDLAAQGLATGGTVTDAGTFMVGERGPEMVTLPNGAAVTSNRDLQRLEGKNGENEEIKLRIEGKDLVGVIDLQRLLNNSY